MEYNLDELNWKYEINKLRVILLDDLFAYITRSNLSYESELFKAIYDPLQNIFNPCNDKKTQLSIIEDARIKISKL